MGGSVRNLVAFLGLAACLVIAALPAFAQLSIENIRFGQHRDKTRLVIDLNGESDFKAFVLRDPYRVVIDLPDAKWEAGGPHTDGRLFRAARYGKVREGVSRIVLEASEPIVIDRAFRLPAEYGRPHRLVLDVRGAPPGVARASLTQVFGYLPDRDDRPVSSGAVVTKDMAPAKIQPAVLRPASMSTLPADPGVPLPRQKPQSDTSGKMARIQNVALNIPVGETLAGVPAPDMVIPKRRPERRLIVLDPGHGGKDPGAIASNGMYEKHITLKMARELKTILEQTGRYRVILTREDDRFLKLHQRRHIAHEAGADMFISLHADSVKRRNVRGTSIYTLSNTASDKETARLAVTENRADAIIGVDLSNEGADVANILIDLAMNENMNQSRLLADMMVDSFGGNGVKTLSTAHRHAGFAVLKSADVPSVLIELGFLSSPSEARALNTTSHRHKLGRAILGGIDAYFARLDHLHRS